jgi:hypothetical protein
MLLAVSPDPPVGSQLYVYVPVPPVTAIVADPLLTPQFAGVILLVVTTMAVGLVIVTVVELLHPPASETVTV